LICRRINHKNLHVRGYKEERTTTTPFDMVVRNDLDLSLLGSNVIDRVQKLVSIAACAGLAVRDKLVEYREYIAKYSQDMTEIRDWTWKGPLSQGIGTSGNEAGR
jgi:xylulose-5-phosphate/fructose-6-phosphate phosphoketolase